MLKIICIEPQYRLDEKNNVSISSCIVHFSLTKKLSNGETLLLVGSIDTCVELDISAIKGKILFHLKNIIDGTADDSA